MSPRRILAARILAVLADALQLGLLPLFAEGAASPLNNALDIVVGIALTWLVGWHWAFLPAFVAELVPGLDLVPTWTAAVFFATRKGASAPSNTAPPVPAKQAVDTKVVRTE
jgi:hypothetical protein